MNATVRTSRAQLMATSTGRGLYLAAMTAIHNARQIDWYDRNFHKRYAAAIAYLTVVRPESVPLFASGLAPLRTRDDFSATRLRNVLSSANFDEVVKYVDAIRPSQTAKSANRENELNGFGRELVRNHPFFTDLQAGLTSLVSGLAGEPLVPSYNFLSLYGSGGRCATHLDHPSAKWTLDICLDQSCEWPIAVSGVMNWPSISAGGQLEGGPKQIPRSSFANYVLQPNDALLFSGSSQWHFRDAIPNVAGAYCHLLFLHYKPAGTGNLDDHETWADHFDLPELDVLFDLMGDPKSQL